MAWCYLAQKRLPRKPSPSQQHHQAMESGEDVTMRRHFHPPSSLLPCHRKPHVCYPPLILLLCMQASPPLFPSSFIFVFMRGRTLHPSTFLKMTGVGGRRRAKSPPHPSSLLQRETKWNYLLGGGERKRVDFRLTTSVAHPLLFPSSGVLLGSAIWPEGGGERAISFFVGKARHFSTWKKLLLYTNLLFYLCGRILWVWVPRIPSHYTIQPNPILHIIHSTQKSRSRHYCTVSHS